MVPVMTVTLSSGGDKTMQVFFAAIVAIIGAVLLACTTMMCLMLWEPGQRH